MHVIFSDVDALKMILLKTNLDVKQRVNFSSEAGIYQSVKKMSTK